jgi:hypothetical protein
VVASDHGDDSTPRSRAGSRAIIAQPALRGKHRASRMADLNAARALAADLWCAKSRACSP